MASIVKIKIILILKNGCEKGILKTKAFMIFVNEEKRRMNGKCCLGFYKCTQ
jgi:hypothetical protein